MTTSSSDWTQLNRVEGLELLGGHGRVRAPLKTDLGLLLDIEWPAGVCSPEHVHDHDSFIYLLSGHLSGTVNGERAELHPGQTLLHPKGVPHTVEAITDSHWLEFKAPPTVTLS
jgi:quercetin dioxygenase-like cupin family protein